MMKNGYGYQINSDSVSLKMSGWQREKLLRIVTASDVAYTVPNIDSLPQMMTLIAVKGTAHIVEENYVTGETLLEVNTASGATFRFFTRCGTAYRPLFSEVIER